MLVQALSHVQPLIRAVLWLALIGLAVMVGQALMGQLKSL